VTNIREVNPYPTNSDEMKQIAYKISPVFINTLNAELNPICHLLALLGAHHIFHVSGLRVNSPHGAVL